MERRYVVERFSNSRGDVVNRVVQFIRKEKDLGVEVDGHIEVISHSTFRLGLACLIAFAFIIGIAVGLKV